MDTLKTQFHGGRFEQYKRRANSIRGQEYRLYWLRISLATARDGNICAIKARAFGIFFIISTFMNKDRLAFPSLSLIAKLSGYTISTVRKDIAKLENEGWLTVERKGRKDDGLFNNCRYHLLRPDLYRWVNEKGFIEDPLLKCSNGQ